MPILWRYLLRSYFQVLLLSVSTFISVLLVLRFQEIARFATSGASTLKVLLFTLYQIPYILPIAIPISCLIAAMLLFQRLSTSHELTAFRSSGLSLKAIATPLLFAAVFLSLLSFTIAFEIAPRCRALSKTLIFEIAGSNPLFILQKESLVKLKNAFIDIKELKAGKCAEDVLFVIKNSSNGRLGIMTAKELTVKDDLLKGKKVAFISSVDPKKGAGFDHLVIENQARMDTKAANLTQFIHNADWATNCEYMTLRMILAKEKFTHGSFLSFRTMGKTTQIELARRLSISLSAFTFTLIGIACGMHISRHRSKKGIIWAIALSACFMVCFVMAKSMRHTPALSLMIFLLPHPIILLISYKFLKSVNRGVE
jgi:lipopolysaccharide export system permease protein